MDSQALAATSLFEAFLITASRDPHTIAWIGRVYFGRQAIWQIAA
jgi:hypothetical protein